MSPFFQQVDILPRRQSSVFWALPQPFAAAVPCWRDLREHGIEILINEAGGLTDCFLIHVSASGKHVAEKPFGVPDVSLGTNIAPRFGSLLLPSDGFTAVAVFSLLESEKTDATRTGPSKAAGSSVSSREMLLRSERHSSRSFFDQLGRRFVYRGTAGDRNRHEFNGRVR